MSQTWNAPADSQPAVVKKSGFVSANIGSALDAMVEHVVAMSASAMAGPAVTASASARVRPTLMALRSCCVIVDEVMLESCKVLMLGLRRGLQTGGGLT